MHATREDAARDCNRAWARVRGGLVSINVSAFRDALVALREAKDGEIATLRTALADAVGARARVAEALTAERARSDVLRERIEALRDELRQAQEAAAARQARGLLARLRAAWRGG